MFQRRPSASTGHGPGSAASSSTRVHRSNDSHHAVNPAPGPPQPPSLAYQGASATPTQRIVQVLVNRLKNKLPCNSGLSIEAIEEENTTTQALEALSDLSMDSLDIVSWSLSEQLERLAKQHDSHGHCTVDVLQSQLFMLKVLAHCMAAHWTPNRDEARSNSRTSKRAGGSLPDSPLPSGGSKRSRQVPSEHATARFMEPPPLDDHCAKYILSVMVLFLRQTAPPETRLVPASILNIHSAAQDFESVDVPIFTESFNLEAPVRPSQMGTLRLQKSKNSVNSGSGSVNSLPVPVRTLAFERTPTTLAKSTLSLNILIAKFAGRIVYHLSASNWSVVLQRLRTKIHHLATTSDVNTDFVDLGLMTHSAMDRVRLVQLMNELSSLLINMRQEHCLACAIPLRNAIWNWIHLFPEEYDDAIRQRGRLDGAPERAFDIFNTKNESGAEKGFWPTMTALICIMSDRISIDYEMGHFGFASTGGQKSLRKETRFLEELTRHANTSHKLSEIAMVCVLDLCRAAAHIRPEGEVSLLIMASGIAQQLKGTLLKTPTGRPVWESPDEIDIGIITETLVTVYRFLSNDESLPIYKLFLEAERSDAVKICCMKACLALANAVSEQPWQRSLDTLQLAIADRLRSVFKAAAARRNEVDQYGNTRRAVSRPKAKRYTSETLSDRELLLLAAMHLWRENVAFYITGASGQGVQELTIAATKLWNAPVDASIKITACTGFRAMGEGGLSMSPDEAYYPLISEWLRLGLTPTILSMATTLLHSRNDLRNQRLWINMIHDYIELYTKDVPYEGSRQILLSPTRLPAFGVAEIALLVSLTCADNKVSHVAARGLRIIAQAERLPGAPVHAGVTDEDRSKRYTVYDQLGDPSVTIVGRVGHQKRLRKLIRLLAYPSPIYVAVWEECYWRWRALSEIVTPSPLEALIGDDQPPARGESALAMEEHLFEWRNLTLFLAALGGACIQEDYDTSALTSVIPAAYLPDEMRVLQNPSLLVTAFVKALTNYLVYDTLQVRDAARDALGSELSPRLYSRLFRHLDEVIREIVSKAGFELTEGLVLFLDQFIAVLKLLVENSQIQSEEVVNIDICRTLQALAEFIARFNDSAAHRIRIKFCSLCDSVLDRSDALSLRKDSGARTAVLDIVMEWLQEAPQTTDGENQRMRHDLHMTSLRSAVKLLDRLDLFATDQGLAEQNGNDDSGHVASRLFHRYATRLLDSLQRVSEDVPRSDSVSDVNSFQQSMRIAQRDAELLELVIGGISHLVVSNTEIGFKHCLPLAYDKDVRRRAVFARVFARVLGQGTKFESQADSALVTKKSRLCELVKGPDLILAIAICETCPAAEVDIMISVLLNLFNHRPALMSLLKVMIDREVAQTENEQTLFRGNTTCTRFLSAFARIHGYNYLRDLIKNLIDILSSMGPNAGYDMDPSKATSQGQDVKLNQKNVEYVTSAFLDVVSDSTASVPSMFREVCAHIAKAVAEYWPEAKFAAIGAFIFLRFISPAIVAPGIVDVDIPAENEHSIRRGLMVIAKLVQNLANNIFFGKEAHMVALNDFLQDHIINMTRYLSDIYKYTPTAGEEDQDDWLGTNSDDTDASVLHRFFDKHADKIGKDLLSYAKPQTDGGDNPAISGKKSWDSLCAVLVDLGPPFEIPRLSPLTSEEHRDYLDLMARYAHRNTASVKNLFVEAGTKDGISFYILFLSRVDIEVLDIELLMFHVFKTLALSGDTEQTFKLIIDCTEFTSASEAPIQWLKYCAELIPSDIRRQLIVTYLLNPNQATLKYFHRLYNISAGTPFTGEIKAFTSVAKLADKVPGMDMTLLRYVSELDEEPRDAFTEVTMRQAHQMRMPVTLQVASTHLRITSVKKQTISPSIQCKYTEVISLADVSDVYNVSTGQDLNEFIVRKSRQGITLYFCSHLRDHVVKTIRTAKTHMKADRLPITGERFSKFTNAPATLLHIGMLNMHTEDDGLRHAAYELLGSVCSFLNYDKNPVVASKAGFIPSDPDLFVSQLSEKLANFAPQMTPEFLIEVVTGMSKEEVSQRHGCLQYLSPWVKNLEKFTNPASAQYEPSGTRLRDSIKALLDATVEERVLSSAFQKYIWTEVGKTDTSVINVVLDELMRAATDGGIGTRRCEVLAQTLATFSSINIRGKIYAKLRKVISKTTAKRFTKSLADGQHWNEIGSLVRLALVAGNSIRQPSHSQIFVPEIAYIVTIVAGTGETLVRRSIYGIVVNLLQSLYLSRAEDSNGTEVRQLLDELVEPETLRLFGLVRPSFTGEYTNIDPQTDKAFIDTQEELTLLLVRIMGAISGTKGLLAVWKARWMSLVTSTAFQHSPIVQARCFVVLGTLAASDVDDDFLYQVFVTFKTALLHSSESETTSVVSILRCIRRIVPALQRPSRYLTQVFWLAVALLQSSHLAFYVEAVELLRVTLETLEEQDAFVEQPMSEVLLEGRIPLEDIAGQLDSMLRLSFETSFSFALAAILFKGMRHSLLKGSAEAALRTLLAVTIRSNEPTDGSLHPEALGFFLALLPVCTSVGAYKAFVESSVKLGPAQPSYPVGILDDDVPVRVSLSFVNVADASTALLLTSFVGAMLSSAQGDDVETDLLYNLLADVSTMYPDIVSMAYDGLQERIKDAFANSSTPSLIKAVSAVFRVAAQDPARMAAPRGSASTLGIVEEGSGINGPGRNQLMALEELNMQGLANSFQFLPPNRGYATTIIQWIPDLVNRIIE